MMNADEVFEMAWQLEQNGEQFYRKAAGKGTGAARDLLLQLANMERDHAATFAKMRAEAGRPEVFDPDGEGMRYLQSYVQEVVFSSENAAKWSDEDTIEQILDKAIDLEKDAIVFYQIIKSAMWDLTEQKKIEAIIMEEVGHVISLREQLADLDS